MRDLKLDFKNKKGNVILESIFILFTLFVLGVISIASYDFFTEINDDIQQDEKIDSEARGELSRLHTKFPSVLDNVFAVALGTLWMITLITSFLIDSHPAFFTISFILLFGFLIAGAAVSNAFFDIENSPELADSASSFPITSWILNHLLHVMAVIGGSLALVLYGKNKLGG